MDIQTFYPVFENGQVLTPEHLNDIVDYLEPQDRLTRTRLTGIGFVCGSEPDWNAAAKTLTLSCCVAVTSEGYLIAEDEVVLDRFRPYTVPIPSGPDATPEEKAKGNMTNSRAIIDACRPFHWKDDFPPVNAPTPEEARAAREKFGYLLDGKDVP